MRFLSLDSTWTVSICQNADAASEIAYYIVGWQLDCTWLTFHFQAIGASNTPDHPRTHQPVIVGTGHLRHVYTLTEVRMSAGFNRVCKHGDLRTIFIARHCADARYWYRNSVCPSVRPSVCLSVRHVPVLYQNGLIYRHNFFTTRYCDCDGSPINHEYQTSSRNSDGVTPC